MDMGTDEENVRLLSKAAGRELVRDDKGVVVIEGNLNLRGVPLLSLPDNLWVAGELNLCGTPIKILPDNLTVGGDLILACAAVTSLPDTLRVGRNLRFDHSAIAALPEDLTVGGSLDLQGTAITSLPENLTVTGDLHLCHTAVTSLPATLRVGGSLNLAHSAIAVLPENLTVCGYLSLTGTPLITLPKNLTVGSALHLQDTAIKSLPENLTVGSIPLNNTAVTFLPENLTIGYLDLQGTAITSLPGNLLVGGDCYLMEIPITSLPESLTVGGDLNLRGTAITSLPESLRVGGNLDITRTAVTTVPLGIIQGDIIQGEPRTSFMGMSCPACLALARDPVSQLRRLLDGFDKDGFAQWVSQPGQAAEQLQQAAPQWNAEEHAQWGALLHSLGGWKEAARPGGGFPLGQGGAALGFEIEVRNREAAEVRTPHTTSWGRAGEYLEQATGYFRRNRKYFPAGYYWNMHLNLSLTAQGRANVEEHLGEIEQVCHRLIVPNNPFGRNVHNWYKRRNRSLAAIKEVSPDSRCPEREDAARLEIKEAAIHADLDTGYLFVCLDVLGRLVQASKCLGPALGRLKGLYQRYGLPAEFRPSASAEAEVVQALLFERAAADFRRAVERSNGSLILENTYLENEI